MSRVYSSQTEASFHVHQSVRRSPGQQHRFHSSGAAKIRAPAEFSRHAHIRSLEEYEDLYKESINEPDKFWSRIASELHWFKKWDKVLEWNSPWAKWFVGGQINLSYNCLDRHVLTARKNKAAIIWESEPGEVRTLTY
ncbi:MAG: acetyl-coenzyme A synthetase N-terminal domain-containing protein, partial [Candidatus Sulfotelmatobacter sp.]